MVLPLQKRTFGESDESRLKCILLYSPQVPSHFSTMINTTFSRPVHRPTLQPFFVPRTLIFLDSSLNEHGK